MYLSIPLSIITDIILRYVNSFDLQFVFSEPIIVSNFGHNLRECLNQVLTIMRKHNISFFIPEEVARVILEIHELDRNNTYFRYIFQDTNL